MKKSTRSTAKDVNLKDKPTPNRPVPLRKIFYITETVLEDPTNELHLERFYHPGKQQSALFITSPERKLIMELVEFNEPRRSWFIDNDVCSNGRIYMSSPIDTTFLVLHYLRKYCTDKAISLDNIHDPDDPSAARLLNIFIAGAPAEKQLACVADVKKAAGMQFYKYNAAKTIAWLAVKTKRVASTFRATGVHCGHNAISQNYARREMAKDETTSDMDYLRMACDFVGDLLDLPLYDELVAHLRIPTEIQARTEEAAAKRKTAQQLDGSTAKKLKTEETNDVAIKLKNSSLLDESLEDNTKDISMTKATPLKERVLSAKEKAMVKGAKGTKSIASFFKK